MVDERDLQKMKVAELKQMLHDYGVTPRGLKADLVRQLLEVLMQREQQHRQQDHQQHQQHQQQQQQQQQLQQQQQMAMQQQLAYQQSLAAGLEMHNQLAGAATLPPGVEAVNDYGEQLYQQQLHQAQLQEQQYLIQQQQQQQQQQLQRQALFAEQQQRLQEEQLRLQEEQRLQRLQQEQQQRLLQEQQLQQERLQQERLQQERLQQERLQQEQLHQERLQQERIQQERLQQERLQQEQLLLQQHQQYLQQQQQQMMLNQQQQQQQQLVEGYPPQASNVVDASIPVPGYYEQPVPAMMIAPSPVAEQQQSASTLGAYEYDNSPEENSYSQPGMGGGGGGMPAGVIQPTPPEPAEYLDDGTNNTSQDAPSVTSETYDNGVAPPPEELLSGSSASPERNEEEVYQQQQHLQQQQQLGVAYESDSNSRNVPEETEEEDEESVSESQASQFATDTVSEVPEESSDSTDQVEGAMADQFEPPPPEEEVVEPAFEQQEEEEEEAAFEPPPPPPPVEMAAAAISAVEQEMPSFDSGVVASSYQLSAEVVTNDVEQQQQQQQQTDEEAKEEKLQPQQHSPPAEAMVNGTPATLPADPKPAVVVVPDEDDDEEGEEEEREDDDGAASLPLLSEAEIAKLSKNQRRKYKKKLRNRQKRKERNLVEKKKQELAKLLANQLKGVEEKGGKAVKREVVEDEGEDDAMEIDDEDEAEEEKEKKRRLEEEERRRKEALKREEEEMKSSLPEKVEIEYVPEAIPKDPVYMQFLKVFDKFSAVSPDEASRLEAERLAEAHRNRDDRAKMLEMKKPIELELKDDDEGAVNADGSARLSKRRLKALTRMSIADLKQNVTHPELVEMHDVTARDPILLLQLKSTRNTVPVPRHWCYKRKYLQGKRGFEKPPFKLPEFIRRTGIQEMREAVQEKEDAKSLKSKMREKIRPKMGKIDIDYQKLHDAFFKWQTKPNMTIHGDLYYEGKEFETRLKDKKPGDLTTELRSALGMPTGPNASKCPPPWLIAMQRYGPPPSYPNLKIPGLNAPIPEGCSFGYHAGGWGKPPVDEYGRPLYGDVFGITAAANDLALIEEEVDRSKWGEPESEEESEAEEEEEEEGEEGGGDEAEGGQVDRSGLVTPAAEGLVTPSGFSTAQGIETPDMIELRKRKQAIEAEMESGENPALFTVIPEKKTDRFGKEMMGSMHVYDFASLSKTSSKSSSRHGDGVEVALDPSELEDGGGLDSHQMAAKYEQSLRAQSGGNPHEDLSDMVAEYAASKQQHKRRKGADQSGGGGQSDGAKSSTSRDKAKKYQFKF